MRSKAIQLSNWFVAGAIGAGVALLFAPRSGRRTRRLIGRKAHHYIRNAGDQLAGKTGDFYILGKEVAEGAAKKLRRRLSLAA